MREFNGTIALRESWRDALSASERAEIERACKGQALAWGYDFSSNRVASDFGAR